MSRWLPWRSRDELSDRRVEDLELLALDIETTGLDPARHEVLSFGMVPVRRLTIELAEARQYAVRPVRGAGVGDSATVHGITDDVAAGAEPMEEVLPRVLAALEGRALLAHHASIEVGFLTAAC
ncbi:MAG TPA: 3'-5' exonuclease, partial [Ornithinicoccus sp.]|nr:3'-5' exonuclease [Ornithinicoccus sp.]